MDPAINTEEEHLFDNRHFLNEAASLPPDDIYMQGLVTYVLYYKDPSYSNKENSPKIQKMENFRKRFILGMKLEKLIIQEESVSKHKFVKIFCPLERLYEEAESIGVELPLYGASLPPDDIYMQGLVTYVLYYKDPSYSNKENSPKIQKMENFRKRFILGMKLEKLIIQEESVSKHKFVKIFCPLERLYEEAESIGVELPLYGIQEMDCIHEETESLIETRMKKLLSAPIRETKVAAPFLRECVELFKKDDHPILCSSIRCYLMYNILININISKHEENRELPKKIGLPYLLMIGAFKDSFPLHDPSAMEPASLDEIQKYVKEYVPYTDLRDYLKQNWGAVCRKQPIHEIRDYFGEKIAFYFAWVSTLITSLWVPAVIGLIVFCFGLVKRIKESNTDTGIMYAVEVIKSSSDNDLTPGFAVIMCLWGTIFMEVWKRRQISLARQWYVDNFDNVEPDRPQFFGEHTEEDTLRDRVLVYYSDWKRFLKYTCSFSVLLMMIMIVFISVTAVIVYRVYLTVAYCGNDPVCDLLHGTIIATLLNTLSIMILGRIYEYIAFKLTEWENHQTLSEHNDALNIKLFVFEFANTYASLFYTAFFRRDFGRGILWFSEDYKDNCGSKDNDNCMSLLSFQLLVLMIVKPIPKFVRDAILPFLKQAFRQSHLNEINGMTDEEITEHNYLLRELQKPSAEDFRLGEFTEKMIQYGYLVLFAASFPLAPALALVFNMIDFKIDSKRLLKWDRRPIPYRDNDIGIWFNIMNFINICGVISNGFLIAFTSEIGREQPLYIKFIIVIAFEHFIFLIKYSLSLIIPDVPTWVKNSRKKERSVLNFFMKRISRDSNDEGSKQKQDFVVDGNLNLESEETHSLPDSRWSYG